MDPLKHSPQQVESMATELDTRCPICLDTWVNPSYVLPCLHRFCFACIQRWAESKPECPLCKPAGMASARSGIELAPPQGTR
uniref:RING-type E3 ubiquitin transferase n=1 Tax=Cairina moschata TaxID=8855 RepID=A0A8C3CYI1_CAIMO